MPKETSHRGDELKTLGWSEHDVSRYVELWEYRQRWGAMNLEREDRQFLRKAEHALPAIPTGRAAAKKAINEKTYYKWIRFHLDAMKAAEADMALAEGQEGAWPVLLEVELRLLDHYQPVLGLPDTLKAKAIGPVRETLATQAAALGTTQPYDFQAALNELKKTESSRWRHLRDNDGSDRTYPLLNAEAVPGFRNEAHREIQAVMRGTFPSLAETEKEELPEE
ncbi:hypothetical protein [Synechococcus sp. MIT S1220]|uniref:hypothetical protein n=1 Tax=Synechococcus sp. MIT S1220 TaxID=3082549 RepID=UPI0039B04B24